MDRIIQARKILRAIEQDATKTLVREYIKLVGLKNTDEILIPEEYDRLNMAESLIDLHLDTDVTFISPGSDINSMMRFILRSSEAGIDPKIGIDSIYHVSNPMERLSYDNSVIKNESLLLMPIKPYMVWPIIKMGAKVRSQIQDTRFARGINLVDRMTEEMYDMGYTYVAVCSVKLGKILYASPDQKISELPEGYHSVCKIYGDTSMYTVHNENQERIILMVSLGPNLQKPVHSGDSVKMAIA